MLRKEKRRISIVLLTFISSLALRAFIPPNALYGAVHDDALMVTLASQIRAEGWIGPWETMGPSILSKGPGYAIFLAANSVFPWPPTVTIHFFLLAAFLLLLVQMVHLGLSKNGLVFWFAIAAFLPVWFTDPISRIYRDGFLTALTVLIIALGLVLSRLLRRSLVNTRLEKKTLLSSAGVALATGAIVGYFFITKVNWQFLAIIVIGLVASSLIGVTWQNVTAKFWVPLAATVLIIASASVPILTVSLANHQRFGVFALENFGSGSFADALKVMMSVEPKSKTPYVDISEEMRREMYRVSPTLAELRPFLELEPNEGWRMQACSNLGICDESATWFPWDIRDAATNAGLADTAREFEATFSRISEEIQWGCQDGRISCSSQGLAPGVNSLDSISPRLFINALANGANQLLTFANSGVSRTPQELPSNVSATWNRVVNGLPETGNLYSAYNSNAVYLSDVVGLLLTVYRIFWSPVVVASVGVLAFATFNRSAGQKRLLVVGLISLGAGLLFMSQLALLEASGGLIMTAGANLYALPVYPLLIVSAIASGEIISRRLSLLLGVNQRMNPDTNQTKRS